MDLIVALTVLRPFINQKVLGAVSVRIHLLTDVFKKREYATNQYSNQVTIINISLDRNINK